MLHESGEKCESIITLLLDLPTCSVPCLSRYRTALDLFHVLNDTYLSSDYVSETAEQRNLTVHVFNYSRPLE